jgi:hypothetical protein
MFWRARQDSTAWMPYMFGSQSNAIRIGGLHAKAPERLVAVGRALEAPHPRGCRCGSGLMLRECLWRAFKRLKTRRRNLLGTMERGMRRFTPSTVRNRPSRPFSSSPGGKPVPLPDVGGDAGDAGRRHGDRQPHRQPCRRDGLRPGSDRRPGDGRQDAIENHLGTMPVSFAYPFGRMPVNLVASIRPRASRSRT